MVSDEFMDEIIESEIENRTTSKPKKIREFNMQRCGMKQDCEKLSRDFLSISTSLNEKESEITNLRKQVKDYEVALKFYGDKSKWFKKEDSVCIADDDTEMSDYINQLGASEYGGKLAREVLKKWGGHV